MSSTAARRASGEPCLQVSAYSEIRHNKGGHALTRTTTARRGWRKTATRNSTGCDSKSITTISDSHRIVAKSGTHTYRTWSKWNAQGRARTSSGRVYRLENRVMIRGNTLGGARWSCGYRDAGGDECRSTETKTKLTCDD